MEAIVRALADESRRTLLEALAAGPATAGRARGAAADRPSGRVAAPAGVAGGGTCGRSPGGAAAGLRSPPRAAGGARSMAGPVPGPVGRAAGRPARGGGAGKTRTKEHRHDEQRHGTVAGSWAACDPQTARASCASRTASRRTSTTCGRHSRIRAASPSGSARSRAICESAASSAHVSIASGWEGTGRVEACEPPNRFVVLTRDADAPDETSDTSHRGQADRRRLGDRSWSGRNAACPSICSRPTGPGSRSRSRISPPTSPVSERADDAKARWDAIFPAYQDLAAHVKA